MKRHGILNSNISRVLSSMGHTDRIAIADCGLPVPEGTERIDLAVTFGNPRFMDVLKAVSSDMKIEAVVLAEEIKEQNPQILEEIQELFSSFETGFKPEKVESKVGKSRVVSPGYFMIREIRVLGVSPKE